MPIEIASPSDELEQWQNTHGETLALIDETYIPHPFIQRSKQMPLSTLLTNTAHHLYHHSEVPHVIVVSGAPNNGKTPLARHTILPLFESSAETIEHINWDEEELSLEDIIFSVQQDPDGEHTQLLHQIASSTNDMYWPLGNYLFEFLSQYKRDHIQPDHSKFLMATYTRVFQKITALVNTAQKRQIIIADVPGATGISTKPTSFVRHPMFETRPYANALCAHLRLEYPTQVYISSIGLGPGPRLYPKQLERYEIQKRTSDSWQQLGRSGSHEQVRKARLHSWAIAHSFSDQLPAEMKEFQENFNPLKPQVDCEKIASNITDPVLQQLVRECMETADAMNVNPRHMLWQMGWDLAAACLLEINNRNADIQGVYLTNPQ